MFRFKAYATAAALLAALGAHAEAAVTTTLTFGGTTNSVYDGGELFGTTQTSYNNVAFSGTISYLAPTTLCNPNNCVYSLTSANNVSETLTINAHTVSFAPTSGSLMFNAYAPQQISFSNLQGPGFNFSSEQFQDNPSPGTAFFGNPANLGAALSFATVSSTNPGVGTGSGGETTSHGYTSIGLNYQSVSASSVTAVSPTAVPEPASLALLTLGVAGIVAVRRRKAA